MSLNRTSQPLIDRDLSDYLDLFELVGILTSLDTPTGQPSQGVSPTPPVEKPLDFNVNERFRS